jgi:molecular chaperone HtpG
LDVDVKEVRLSARLRESAAVLVADEYGMSAHLERLLHRMGRGEEIPENKRILELNPEHPVVQGLRAVHEKDASDARVETGARLLFDEAVVAEGSRVKDPVGFAKRINELLAKQVVEST